MNGMQNNDNEDINSENDSLTQFEMKKNKGFFVVFFP